jgi:AcrR family transcriptional regulator
MAPVSAQAFLRLTCKAKTAVSGAHILDRVIVQIRRGTSVQAERFFQLVQAARALGASQGFLGFVLDDIARLAKAATALLQHFAQRVNLISAPL